ncbi:MAG: DUF2079 domain-containing protein, partial [Chloroflexota bacterium]
VVGSAILGLAWLASYLAARGIPRRRVMTIGSIFLLLMSVANTRVNGFTPGAATFEWPPISAHVRLADQMLALIPATASVSAQDTLNPHLSDRAGIYLFPDTTDAQYVALDMSANPIPSSPDSQYRIVRAMLASRRWDVLFANDGLLLLRRRARPSSTAPILPSAFSTFALPAHPAIEYPLRVMASDGLELLGYTISRRETVNLRMPDVVLTMYWRATRPLTQIVSFPTTVTNETGRINGLSGQNASAVEWLPVDRWRLGQTMSVTTVNMGVSATLPGTARVCLGVTNGNPARVGIAAALPLRIEQVSRASGWVQPQWGGRALCVGTVPVVF